ncbi:transducin beta-like protein 3 isoform X2 [Festucalex cinctus]
MANIDFHFKTNYAVSSKIEPFYKGGKVQISKDEQYIFCTCGSRVNVLEISTGKIVHSIEHDDQEDITSFALSCDDEMLVTASRALLLKQWDWRLAQCTRSWKAIHTVPIASMTFDCTSTLLATGGCDGTIKLWDVVKQYCTHNLKGSSGVVHLVQFHPDIDRLQLFSSSLDCGIRLWDLHTSQCVCVLQSHYSAVTSLSFSPDGDTMISSGRDKICTVWDLKSRTAKRTVPVYEAVEGIVILPVKKDLSQIGVQNRDLHFITAGSKGLLRVWEASTARCVYNQVLPSTLGPSSEEDKEPDDNPRGLTYLFHLATSARLATVTAEHNIVLYQLPALSTQQQDINSVAVSPNDKLLATGSQDRTAKLWSLAGDAAIDLLGVFRGHRRGVWSVCFSPVDQVLATSSADGTAKLWSLQDFNCLKTFEGHDTSVLKIIFVSRGTQLLSSGSDGLLKLWTIKTNECVKTLDAHQDKVWGLHANKKDDKMVTGSADSNITVWMDVTEMELAEEQVKQEDQIMKQQELSNLLHEKKYLKALGLAISLDQPHTVLSVIKAIRQTEDSSELLEKTVLKLRVDQKESLLRYCGVWNTNARNCLEAQAVLKVLLTHLPPEELLQYQGARTVLEGLIPYTERHMQRIGRLLQASMFLNYMWQKMRVAGAPSSMSQDEEMDTTPLGPEPVFMIDKEGGKGSGDDQRDEGDSGNDEDPNCPAEEEEEEDDEKVSSAQKVTTNGNHHSESESSAEEDEEQMTVTPTKSLTTSTLPPLSALTS